MKRLITKPFWKAVLFLGCTPYLACLWAGVDGAISGISFLWGSAENGLDGFLTAVLFFTYLFWPAFLIGLMLILVALLALAYLKYK